MLKLLLTYAHLIATCLAIGIIVTTDLRLLVKMARYRCMLRAPRRFETNTIALALIGLCLSGAGLISIGLDANPDYLHNPKLQAKLLLVTLLCANAFALHRISFPRLSRSHAVATWTRRDHLSVALPVAMSTTLWLYCAFLGIARSWNNSKPVLDVLLPAAVLFALLATGILLALRVAARDTPQTPPDWIDSMKARLSDRVPLGPYRAPFEEARDSQLQ